MPAIELAHAPEPAASKMEFSLRQIGQVLGTPVERAALITGWSTDTRSIAPGDLYFALRGANFDGNAFVADALSKGAVAAIANANAERDPRILAVSDTLKALQRVAAWARREWAG